MFFYLSKLIWFFLQPTISSVILVIVGLALTKTKWARWGKRAVVTGIIAQCLILFSPLGRQLIIPLEDRFPVKQVSQLPDKQIDGIIVLGGAINTKVTRERGQPSIFSAAERITEAVKLAKRYPKARVFLSGGSFTLGPKRKPESEIIKEVMVSMGINPNRIEQEGRSLNTWQNAINSLKHIQPKPGETWYVITSAFHMPRAIGSFRTAGFDVKAFPVDYQTGGKASQYDSFYFAKEAVAVTDTAAKEWVGLIVYWLTGRNHEFLAGPK